MTPLSLALLICGEREGFSLSQRERAGVRENDSFLRNRSRKWDAPFS